MKPTTDRCLGHERLSAANASDTQTFTLPKGTSHIDLQAFTTDAFVTLDGTDPSAVVAGLRIYAGQMPLFRPLGQGTDIKHVSVAGTASVLIVSYYQ